MTSRLVLRPTRAPSNGTDPKPPRESTFRSGWKSAYSDHTSAETPIPTRVFQMGKPEFNFTLMSWAVRGQSAGGIDTWMPLTGRHGTPG